MGCFSEKVFLLPSLNFVSILLYLFKPSTHTKYGEHTIFVISISLILPSYLGRTCVVFGSNETKPTVAFRLGHFFRKINQTKLLIYNTFSLFN